MRANQLILHLFSQIDLDTGLVQLANTERLKRILGSLKDEELPSAEEEIVHEMFWLKR